MQNYSLNEKIKILVNSANFLSYKTFPACKIGEDLDVSILKTTDIIYDGYSCGVYHSISKFSNYKIKILQIWSKYHSFIPFDSVFGLTNKFLGFEGLCFFEIWNNEKIIYCWTLVLDNDNNIIKDFYKKDQKEQVFNGQKYYSIDAPDINII